MSALDLRRLLREANPFDPLDDVTFQGKPLKSLTREEAIEALAAALRRVRELETGIRF